MLDHYTTGLLRPAAHSNVKKHSRPIPGCISSPRGRSQGCGPAPAREDIRGPSRRTPQAMTCWQREQEAGTRCKGRHQEASRDQQPHREDERDAPRANQGSEEVDGNTDGGGPAHPIQLRKTSQALGGQSPAQAARTTIEGRNKWMTLLKNAVRDEE